MGRSAARAGGAAGAGGGGAGRGGVGKRAGGRKPPGAMLAAMAEPRTFHEANLWTVAIRDLGLTIEGTRLEPIVAAFAAELERAGIRKLRTRFYLSMEWGVPFDTIAVAIPFYLARE